MRVVITMVMVVVISAALLGDWLDIRTGRVFQVMLITLKFSRHVLGKSHKASNPRGLNRERRIVTASYM